MVVEPTIAGALLKGIVASHLRRLRREWNLAVLSRRFTRVQERAGDRLPNLALCPLPLPEGKVLNTTPWAVVEILTPEDRLREQLERFREYQQLGVRHVVLLDPQRCIAYRFETGSLMQTVFTELILPTGALPFNTDEFFRQLASELNEGLF